MNIDITHYCESCIVCARRKVPRRVGGVPMLSPQQDWIAQYGPMECLAVDIIGPMTTSGHASYILTIVDVYTRYGGAVPLLQQTTRHIALALAHKWFTVHGMPRAIISDNGAGFASDVMKKSMREMGIRMRYVLPYHPQSNGICEKLNGTVINMLSSYLQPPERQKYWSHYLSHDVFAYNTSTHMSTGYSPYQLVFGRCASIGLICHQSMLSYKRHIRSTNGRNCMHLDFFHVPVLASPCMPSRGHSNNCSAVVDMP